MLDSLQRSRYHICSLWKRRSSFQVSIHPWAGQLSTQPSSSSRSLAVPCCASASPSPRVLSSQQPKKEFNVRPLTKDDVEFTFARSGGAGGQNVNKVNTKVDMRFDLNKASWIPEEVADALRQMERNRFTKEGVLVVTSTKHRTQSQNVDDALTKLQEMIDAAVEFCTPKEVDPETVKKVQKSIKVAKEKRLDAKKRDSKKKSERRRRDWD